jgi:hypothetical protein
VRVFVPGFDTPTDPAAPALPLRRALVDAVVGKKVHLVSAEPFDQSTFPGLVPSAAGRPEMLVSRDGTVRPSRRPVTAARLSRGYVPRELARLAGTVFQGETKSAVLEIFPLRLDGGRRQLVLAGRLRLRLAFSGQEDGEAGEGSLGRALPRKRSLFPDLLAHLHTSRRGLHAVSFETLFPGRPRGFSTLFLRLQRQGEAVPFRIEPPSFVFGPASTLYFFADRTASSTDFSGELAYELVRSAQGSTMGRRWAHPQGAPAASSSTGLVSFEKNRIYQPGLLDAADPWLWEAMVGGAAPRTVSFTLSGKDPASTQDAHLAVSFQGGSESALAVDHHLRVFVNDVPVGETSFAGVQPHRLELPLPASVLREGENLLSLANLGDTGVASLVFLDRFELAYPQASSLRGGSFEGVWAESGTVEVTGIAGLPIVLDLTDTRWLTGFETTPSSVRFQAEAGHRYLVVSPEGLLSPRVQSPLPSTLRDTRNQADYLLITPQSFLDAAQPLLERRASQGLAARAVSLEEIAQTFGHAQVSPEAIRDFLSFAFHSWRKPSPRYVLLLGDSTDDPQRFLPSSSPSPLPALRTRTSYLWTAADPLLAAVNGEDNLPDLAIGRLPATTQEEAARLVQKLLDWEDSGQDLAGKALLVADNPDAGGNFEADIDDIHESFLQDRDVLTLRLRELGGATRPEILHALDSGLSLMSYVGHGGPAVWASENVFNSWDVPSLSAQPRQPLLLTLNCLNGYFLAPNFDSLAEALLKAHGRGAIAAFSPSGLSLDGPAHLYHRTLVAEITSGQHLRLGDALLEAQKTYAQSGLMPELLSVYHLLADPAMRILPGP